MSQLGTNNEKLLVIDLMKGNEKAFSKVFNMYSGDVYSYSISMLKNKELAEEILQDVFLNIWQHRERINPGLSFKSYVFTITRNLTFNLLKKVAISRKLKEEVFYTSQKLYSHIEETIESSDYEIIKTTAIDQLPPKRKIIFEMSRNEEKSYKEISDELNISLSTVKGQMSKALTSIRNFLKTHGDVALLITILPSILPK